jgi:hypothetical protein
VPHPEDLDNSATFIDKTGPCAQRTRRCSHVNQPPSRCRCSALHCIEASTKPGGNHDGVYPTRRNPRPATWSDCSLELEGYVTENAVYHNIPMQAVQRRRAIPEFIASFLAIF